MAMTSGPDSAREATTHLHEQIEEHRRELARTVSALHDKTDVKGRVKGRVKGGVKERAAGAEIAVADLTRWAGRAVDAFLRLLRRLLGRPR